MYQTIRLELEPDKFIEQLIANLLEIWVDADHARDLKTRKSVTSIIVTMLGVAVHWHMSKQTCIASHSTDAEIRAFYQAVKMNRYLRMILEWMYIPLKGPTTIWEDNQPAIDIMTAGQSGSSRVKHMATAVAFIHQDICAGNAKPSKIDGRLNIADIGTKPLASSTLHRHFRQARGHRFYPPSSSEHGKMLQVDMVNQRLTEFDTAAPTYINFKQMMNAAVYDNKEQGKK